MKIKTLMLPYQQIIEHELEKILALSPSRLVEAMQYAVLGGGKRLRGVLVFLVGQLFNAKQENLIYSACAVEFIHAYSLIHDDLPTMDNSDLRRGKPSCHKVFGDAIAILAGDALQALGFETLTFTSADILIENRLKMIQILTKACGYKGMAGGQGLDLLAEGQLLNLNALENIHHLKTGALIKASILLGALTANCQEPKILLNLEKFGQHLGLAFQIRDDLLDVQESTETLGKPQGIDRGNNKNTYCELLGVHGAEERLNQEIFSAKDCLNHLDVETDNLRMLVDYIAKRKF